MTVRKVDFSSDEFIAGVAGKLSLEEIGLYWLICSLVYSKRGPVDNDPAWLARFTKDTDPRTVRACLKRLIEMGKVEQFPGLERAQIVVRRCLDELERAAIRVRVAAENGAKGGRVSGKSRGSQNQTLRSSLKQASKLSPSPSPPKVSDGRERVLDQAPPRLNGGAPRASDIQVTATETLLDIGIKHLTHSGRITRQQAAEAIEQGLLELAGNSDKLGHLFVDVFRANPDDVLGDFRRRVERAKKPWSQT